LIYRGHQKKQHSSKISAKLKIFRKIYEIFTDAYMVVWGLLVSIPPKIILRSKFFSAGGLFLNTTLKMAWAQNWRA
jgi:hypothetical protein